MLRNLFIFILLLNLGIKSDFIDDYCEDLMKCFENDVKSCSSTKLKTKNL